MLVTEQLSPQAFLARLLARVPPLVEDDENLLGHPDAPAQDDAALDPIEHMPMAVDGLIRQQVNEPALPLVDEEPQVLDAAPAALSEEEIANVQAEASDADLLSDANVEAEEDAIALHESSFAAAGTGDSVGVRRSGARNARMPLMLQDYELRRPGRVRRL